MSADSSTGWALNKKKKQMFLYKETDYNYNSLEMWHMK